MILKKSSQQKVCNSKNFGELTINTPKDLDGLLLLELSLAKVASVQNGASRV